MMPGVAPVTAMHEEVNEGARQHQRPGEKPEDVHPVLSPEEEDGDGGEEAERESPRHSRALLGWWIHAEMG